MLANTAIGLSRIRCTLLLRISCLPWFADRKAGIRQDIDPLATLPKLKYLSLLENAVTKKPDYRCLMRLTP